MLGYIDLESHPDVTHHEPKPGTPYPADPMAELPNPEPGAHQDGQEPGRATPDTHPAHFMEAKVRHPAGPWTPNTGVGEQAQRGFEPTEMHLHDQVTSQQFTGTIKPLAKKQRTGPPPVPVVVVPPDTDENYRTVSSTAGPQAVGDQAAQFLGRDLKRIRALLVNEGTNPIRVGFTPQLSQNQGYLVAAGGLCEIKTTSEVFVVDATLGSQSIVSAMVETGQSGPTSKKLDLTV